MALLRLVKVEQGRFQRQPTPGKGPYPLLDPHACARQQLIAHRTVIDRNARIEALDCRDLTGRALQIEQIGEAYFPGDSAGRAKGGGEIDAGGAEHAIAGDGLRGPANVSLAADRADDIGDHTIGQLGKLIGLEVRAKADPGHGEIGVTKPGAQIMRDHDSGHLHALCRLDQRAGGGDAVVGQRQRDPARGQRLKAW
ncbi:hypothetical protein D9M73_134730 [compost metagenome]